MTRSLVEIQLRCCGRGPFMSGNIDVLIIAHNEALNLGHCLESLQGWVRKIHVIDSGSTDGTQSLQSPWALKLCITIGRDTRDKGTWALNILISRPRGHWFLTPMSQSPQASGRIDFDCRSESRERHRKRLLHQSSDVVHREADSALWLFPLLPPSVL